ncbi:MAG: glycosyl hydrolase family 18 protein [Eubacteriales bacterium]
MNKKLAIGLGVALVLGTAASILLLGRNTNSPAENTTDTGEDTSSDNTNSGSTNTTNPQEESTNSSPSSDFSGLRNVMYYSDWSIWGGQDNYYPEDLPTAYYTHLNFCFLDFDAAGYLIFTDPDAATAASMDQDGVIWGEANAGILPALLAQRAENPNMKLGVSVGGWTKSGDFALMAANDSTRATFVSQMMGFLAYTGFDFIDIDWEYPAVVRQGEHGQDEGTPSASPADKENYIKLLTDLREAMDEQGARLGKYYELSVALPIDKAKLEAGIDLKAMFEVIDFGNMMTYDAKGAFDTVTGHHTPLYGNPADPFYEDGLSADQCVQYMLAQGVPSEKIVIGAAFYSRGWMNVEKTEIVSGLPGLFVSNDPNGNYIEPQGADETGGIWPYRKIDQLIASSENMVEYWDDVAKAPYLYNGSAFYTYDNPQSISEKTKYVKEHNLGGMISWQSSNDKVTDVPRQRDELTKAIYQGLFGDSSLPQYEIVTSPVNLLFEITNITSTEVTFSLKNLELIEETTAVLRPLETKGETVSFPKIYIESDVAFLSTEQSSKTENLMVVDLAQVYENRFLPQQSVISFTLSLADTSVPFTEDMIKSVYITHRNSLSGVEYGKQVIFGNGKVDVSTSGNVPSGGASTVTPSVSAKPVGTLENPVPWNRGEEAQGVYVTGSVVSYQGIIYEQSHQDTLWWNEPGASPEWTKVGEMEGYVPSDPEPWTREKEAQGLYTPGVRVSHNGKIYLQVSDQTLWWCEPGTEETSWQEQP